MIAAAPGGVWCDVAGKAGILFTPEEWIQFAAETVALALELATQLQDNRPENGSTHVPPSPL